MSALTVRLPNSVHEKIKELAKRDDISVNQFDYLRSEASKGKRGDFEHYLSMMPDAPALTNDEPVK